ncbi:unnamed protein product [Symbiodinium microadriaticum]|nr:unnamed protein product [Symbiodinium microadriaticum]
MSGRAPHRAGDGTNRQGRPTGVGTTSRARQERRRDLAADQLEDAVLRKGCCRAESWTWSREAEEKAARVVESAKEEEAKVPPEPKQKARPVVAAAAKAAGDLPKAPPAVMQSTPKPPPAPPRERDGRTYIFFV